ncbi:MAG TPA: fibronectin type III domain-containing protein [Candidatus Angelobacter sp.]|nr:fibronectin type III domain-containing protein [Candidatus Angelobacter sp.]
MKRIFTLLGISLMLLGAGAWAQKQKPDQQKSEAMDSKSEKAVHITQGPSVNNISGNAATINWSTNTNGANHVRYRIAGSSNEWQSAYHQGGGTSHTLELTGLQPHKTYEYQILTRDGDVRKQGEFQTK